tara:strand:- start:280 stop:504 length:225 start_codon:yes stop_codon:yes gene_type:complete
MNIVSSRKLHTEQNTKSEETLISAFVESQNQLDSKITQINNRFDGLYSKVVTIDMIEEKFNYFKKEIDENKINE